ncbi:hypothetical protein AB0I94_17765 [Streptomyces sp. NPDC050147]
MDGLHDEGAQSSVQAVQLSYEPQTLLARSHQFPHGLGASIFRGPFRNI